MGKGRRELLGGSGRGVRKRAGGGGGRRSGGGDSEIDHYMDKYTGSSSHKMKSAAAAMGGGGGAGSFDGLAVLQSKIRDATIGSSVDMVDQAMMGIAPAHAPF